MEIVFSDHVFAIIKSFLVPKDLCALLSVCGHVSKHISVREIKCRICDEIDRRLDLIFENNIDSFKSTMTHLETVIGGSFVTQCILGEMWEHSSIDIYVTNCEVAPQDVKTCKQNRVFPVSERYQNVLITEEDLLNECVIEAENFSGTQYHAMPKRYHNVNFTDHQMYLKKSSRARIKNVNYGKPHKRHDTMFDFFYEKGYHSEREYPSHGRGCHIKYRIKNATIKLIHIREKRAEQYFEEKSSIYQCLYNYNNGTRNLRVHHMSDICARHASLKTVNVHAFVKLYDRKFTFYKSGDVSKQTLSRQDIHNMVSPCLPLIVNKVSNEPFIDVRESIADYFTVSDKFVINNCIYRSNGETIDACPHFQILNYSLPNEFRMEECLFGKTNCITRFLYPGLLHLHCDDMTFILLQNK